MTCREVMTIDGYTVVCSLPVGHADSHAGETSRRRWWQPTRLLMPTVEGVWYSEPYWTERGRRRAWKDLWAKVMAGVVRDVQLAVGEVQPAGLAIAWDRITGVMYRNAVTGEETWHRDNPNA